MGISIHCVKQIVNGYSSNQGKICDQMWVQNLRLSGQLQQKHIIQSQSFDLCFGRLPVFCSLEPAFPKGRNILLCLRYSVVTQLPRWTRFHLWFSDGCGCCKALILMYWRIDGVGKLKKLGGARHATERCSERVCNVGEGSPCLCASVNGQP